ncbi:protein RoBo-1-like [Meriones unguiculatus]|uniref:protein RoBo-1-like n=1 Tax=Meriones unguiculatus TaxID=10047 RepID=UPI000B4ED566|nr:protein RoBo-1-like [Meriones unguiculatus]XP_060221006.1 protein RoBo-1-like [Meriones unguiculatus]
MSWYSVLKSLLAVCVFTNLSVLSVESYRCINKGCFNGRCSSNTEMCESSHGCFSQLQEFQISTTIPGSELQKKDCSKDACTNLAFSATLGSNQTFRYNHQCCYTEKCNKEPLEVSPPSSQPNGVECPACYSEDGECNPVPLKCTGGETKCVEVTGRGWFNKIHAMGCATATACNVNMIVLETTYIHTSCTNGSPPLRSILSLLSGLFLMKALL